MKEEESGGGVDEEVGGEGGEGYTAWGERGFWGGGIGVGVDDWERKKEKRRESEKIVFFLFFLFFVSSFSFSFFLPLPLSFYLSHSKKKYNLPGLSLVAFTIP